MDCILVVIPVRQSGSAWRTIFRRESRNDILGSVLMVPSNIICSIAKTIIVDSLIIIFSFSSGYAQNRSPEISAIQAQQRSGTALVDITYDIADAEGDTLAIMVLISVDGGSSFTIMPAAIYGDTGTGIMPGTGKTIVWDAGVDHPGLYGAELQVKLIVTDAPGGMRGMSDGYGDYVYIPAGEFLMGDNFGEGYADEKPVHKVWLDDYYIGKYEVTNSEYKRFMDDGGYADSLYWNYGGFGEYGAQPKYWTSPNLGGGGIPGNENLPVLGISWHEAEAYCRWTSTKTGKEYRLPTEAEWEKAARGIDQRRYPWGDTIDGSNANYFDSGDSYPRETPVGYYDGSIRGSFKTRDNSSPYGAYDMAGNVWEWCYDRYDSTFYSSDSSSNPAGPASGNYRVLRGGSWINYPETLRSACRNFTYPGTRNGISGFRCHRKHHGEAHEGLSNVFALNARTAIIRNEADLSSEFVVHQNYPNPFNPSTIFSFSMAKGALVEVQIYDVRGVHLNTLYCGFLSPGNHEMRWDGLNKFNLPLSSGTYFYRTKCGDYYVDRKMQIIK